MTDKIPVPQQTLGEVAGPSALTVRSRALRTEAGVPLVLDDPSVITSLATALARVATKE